MQDAVIEFKKFLIKEKRSGLVLDIDETLSWTSGFWMQQMLDLFGNPEGLTLKEMVGKYKYVQNVPHFNTAQAQEWIADAIKTTGYREEMPLVENSHHFVNQINKIIPIVGYVTARPTNVLDVTKSWLAKHKFPDEPVIARPGNVIHDNGTKWKAGVLKYLSPQVVGIVDDNPELVEHLNGYKGIVYLYDNEESLGGKIRVIPCKTWPDVHAQVLLLHGKKK